MASNYRNFRKVSALILFTAFLVSGYVFAQETAEGAFNKGVGIFRLGYDDEAILSFTRAIELDPDSAQTYMYRGEAYSAINNYNKAWADMHKAEELGAEVHPRILEDLKKASGREK